VGKLRSIGASTSVQLDFQAKLSSDFIDEVIDDTGVRPPEDWEVSFVLSEVNDAGLRRRLRQAHQRYGAVSFLAILSRPQEDAERFLEMLEPWLDQVEAEEAAAAENARAEAEAEIAVMAAFTEEMGAWVSEFGSPRLRLAADGGYRANTTYALERAKLEMPGFWVDTANDCEWGDRADPSEEALVLEKSVRSHLWGIDPSLSVRIVWLTETPRALDRKMEAEGYNFEAQEALMIPGYLGRYLLVMPLESLLQRDPSEDY
jgi:hypothetical protein